MKLALQYTQPFDGIVGVFPCDYYLKGKGVVRALRLIGSLSAPFTEFLTSALLEDAEVGLLRLRSLEKRFEASAELILL